MIRILTLGGVGPKFGLFQQLGKLYIGCETRVMFKLLTKGAIQKRGKLKYK